MGWVERSIEDDQALKEQYWEQVPVTFVDREFGESKMTSSIVLEAIWRVWKLRLRRPRAAPGT